MTVTACIQLYLVTQGLKEYPNCYRCEERGNLRHILSGCPVSLAWGRYRWRHDTVLREVAAVIESERKKNKKRIVTTH